MVPLFCLAYYKLGGIVFYIVAIWVNVLSEYYNRDLELKPSEYILHSMFLPQIVSVAFLIYHNYIGEERFIRD